MKFFSAALLSLLSVISLDLAAQIPMNVQAEKAEKSHPPLGRKMACDQQFAGTVNAITAISAQSNDIDKDTTFLCLGDEIAIDHAGDFNLSDDPSPNTPPGIGYVFYDCPPTRTGPNLAAIQNEPCTNTTSPILINGQLVSQVNGVWVTSQNANGDAVFINDGNLIQAFGGGRPVQFWFAPITLDEFSTNSFFQDPVTNEIGPCVNANTNAAFSVVYLNKIDAGNPSVNGCQGSFTVQGGLPEFRTTSRYTVTITKVNSPGVSGNITSGPVRHGSTVQFDVPEPGSYEIVIEDGKSCGTTFRMNLGGCNGINITSTNEVVLPGERICVDISVDNFVDVLSLQYTIEWDPTILAYDGVEVIPAVFPGLDVNSFGDFSGIGALTFSWNNPDISNGLTLPDGSVIFRLCFIAIGPVGTNSPINFTGNLTDIEVRNSVGVLLGFSNIPVGRVFISDRVLITEYQIDTTCFGLNEGGFTLHVFGGQPPYVVNFRNLPSGGVQGPFNISTNGGFFSTSNLPAGNYEVIIRDNAGVPNVQTDTIEVATRPQFTSNILPVQDILCHGDANGILRAFPLVNNIPVDETGYRFIWNNGATTPVISNLAPRQYVVTVTDPYDCVATTNFTLQDQALIAITASTTNASCSGRSDGGLNITQITGGVPISGNYNISIRGPDGFQFNSLDNIANINGLRNGQYTVIITDNNGCRLDTFLRISAVKEISVDVTVIDNVSCAGGSDGEIFVQGITQGGPAATPYTFQWISVPPIPPANITSTATTSSVNNLRARTYQLVMNDVNGCRFDTSFVITQPDSIRISIANIQNESCIPGGDGAITVNVSGGTAISGIYTYNWGFGPQINRPSINNLPSGNYVLSVTDDEACSDTLHFRISAASGPSILNFENDTLPCATSSSGLLSVIAVSGTRPIVNYSWSNGQSGANQTTISNLSPGCYVVTIEAADGCTTIDTACVVAPPALQLDSFLVQKPTCPGDGNGAIIVFVSGGVAPYTYTWSNNPASPSGFPVLAGVGAGTYTLSVTDANAGICPPLVQAITIDDPPAIRVQLTVTDTVSCYQSTCDGGARAVAIYSDNSLGSFDFSWSSGETSTATTNSSATMLCQGVQTVTVSDGTCGVVQVLNIPSKEPLIAQISVESISCNGRTDGKATVTPAGGKGPFTYLWSNGATTPMVTNLSAGITSVDITDANGCTFSTDISISEPDPFVIQVDQGTTRDVTCPEGEDGQITVVTNGGNPGGISYTWSGGVASSLSNVAVDLLAGTYFVTATDVRGCQATVSHQLNEPPPIRFTLDEIPPILCFGFTTSVRPANVSGGNGPSYAYSINQQPSQDINLPTSVFAETYTMTVFDSRNCSTDTLFTINQPNPIVVNLDPVIEVELGDSITLRPTIIPGGPPINNDSIFWTPSTYLSCDRCRNPVVRPLESQTYFVTVYDFNGCEGTAQITVDVDKNRNVYLPNVFSPNGDGINDEFRIYTGPGVQEIKSVRLFDRWGNILYEATGVEPSDAGVPTWDGTFKGKPLDPAVFVYLVEVTFLDGRLLLYRGDVTLIR